MLIEFNVSNVSSFHKEQIFSMLASTSTKEDLINNTVPVGKYSIDRVLKSSAIFGANGSGKSNLCNAISKFKEIVLLSLSQIDFNLLDTTIPFILCENFDSDPIEFEVSFLQNDVFYRYGISVLDKKIEEEWLFRNHNKRETELFHRKKQSIQFNKASFKEANDFVEEKDSHLQILKTKENVPFVSILAQFNGEISSEIIDWFRNINVISGTEDAYYGSYTVKKIKGDINFKTWALSFLSNFQISDVIIETIEEKGNAQQALNIPSKTRADISFVKKISSNQAVSMPFELESEGIKKAFHSLGLIYDTLKNNRILIFDEFDNKFHTLLSKYLIQSFNEESHESQLIITAHDTNLLSRDILRRDQIWFVEKNEQYESEVFSLLEYKEHYSRKTDSYRKDYLAGKYGAVPLFENHNLLDEISKDGEK